MLDGWWQEQVAGVDSRPLPDVYDPEVPERRSQEPEQRQHNAVASPRNEWERWWLYARGAAHRFARGISPPEIEVFGPVLGVDEFGLLEADLAYSRLYAAGDGRYEKTSMLVVGRPAVMVGALAVGAAVNHRRKVAAQHAAEQRWRDHQQIRVTATNHRLLCNTLDAGFESYYYGGITEFYPDLDGWQLTLAFDGKVAPLRLAGPAAPALCLWTATAVLGDRWIRDSRLAKLFG
ncbi:hypothetical protein [Mycobacterium aquaticum]|uniref:hypothetical protein n=1 Tax=Mycobacterium aquaticum TaxID=1927124 RepID=UPI001152496A|nr:hypothetical protein [Mycobacterium aquaticum]